jgi:hypothetical protein
MIDATNLEVAKKVNRAGDTMTGALVVNPAPAVPTSLDVKGTLQTEQLKLIAPTGTTSKAVLTYESTTGFAKWMETSLTAWNLVGGNLSTEATAVTGSVTIGRSTTINGNLQVNGTLNGRTVGDAATLGGQGPGAFSPASHNHDDRYLSSVHFSSNEYIAGQARDVVTLLERPGVVTFAYNLYDGGIPDWNNTFVNGPLSNFIEVKVIKVNQVAGAKDYKVTVKNNSGTRLWIGVEVFE